MSPIAITYRLALPEFMAASESHWSTHKQGSRTNVMLAVVGVLLGCVWLPFNSWGAFPLVAGIVLFLMVLVRSFLWRRAYREATKFAGDIAVTFSDENIHVVTNDGVSDLKWSVYTGYLDAPDFVLLYMTSRAFSVIPKSAFASVPAQREFVNLVDSKLGPARQQTHASGPSG